MTIQELRELDAWIAEHVMGWTPVDSVLKIFGHGQFALGSEFSEPVRVMIYEGYSRIQSWVPTEKGADAMDVIKKCAEGMPDIVIHRLDTGWEVAWVDWNAEERADVERAETLELAICLFAKKLFS